MAALDGSGITWPGVDRERARAAAFHLERVLLRLRALELDPTGPNREWTLASIATHLRVVRGYLGAVGFERRGRS